MQHTRHPNAFALGDAGSTPNSKTGAAAIRKKAPVVVDNLRAVMGGDTPQAQYDGYAFCPLTTARTKMLIAEFDYEMKPAPSFKFIDTTKERHDMAAKASRSAVHVLEPHAEGSRLTRRLSQIRRCGKLFHPQGPTTRSSRPWRRKQVQEWVTTMASTRLPVDRASVTNSWARGVGSRSSLSSSPSSCLRRVATAGLCRPRPTPLRPWARGPE